MQKEIFNAYNGQTEYDNIFKLNKERVSYIKKFQTKYRRDNNDLTDDKIKKLCEDFDCLRKYNLLLV